MIVRVHPHKTKVNSGIEACVSVTPVGGHARYYGTVIMENTKFVIHQSGLARARKEQVRNVHAWAIGELVSTDIKQQVIDTTGMKQVTYHYNIGRFVTLDKEDVTDERFDKVVFVGRDFYVSS